MNEEAPIFSIVIENNLIDYLEEYIEGRRHGYAGTLVELWLKADDLQKNIAFGMLISYLFNGNAKK